MLAFFNLIGGFKGIIIALVIAAALGWVFVQKRAVTNAEEARDAAIVAQQQIQSQLDKAIDAARENERTIDRLQEEKADIQIALNKRDADRSKNQQRTNQTGKNIDKQATAPVNQTVISPVLKSVIGDVQAERAARRASSPR